MFDIMLSFAAVARPQFRRRICVLDSRCVERLVDGEWEEEL